MLIYVSEALRMYLRNLRVRKTGFTRYDGDAAKICKDIVQDCWNGKYFCTSTGHFKQFWIRDLSYFVDALLHLGHGERLLDSYTYAMGQFMAYGRITTTLTPKGVPFDVFTYAVDSLPLLLRSMRKIGYKPNLDEKEFLNKEIRRFMKLVIGPDGLVRKDRHFSSAKDNAKRQSSLYSNVMVWILQQESNLLGLECDLDIDYPTLILEKFWRGTHFVEDLSGKDLVSGDANVIPYWAGLYSDRKMIMSSLKCIRKNGLDTPLPLKYTKEIVNGQYMWLLEQLVPNYEGNSIWTQWGMLYIEVVSKVNKRLAKEYLRQFRVKIEEHKTFVEVFSPDGGIFCTPLYHADEGMIWAANFPYLLDLTQNT